MFIQIDILFNNAGICIHKDTLEASIEGSRKPNKHLRKIGMQ
jgi:NADP-dependent 3-hydroxy acid dehydrogenase YdfG